MSRKKEKDEILTPLNNEGERGREGEREREEMNSQRGKKKLKINTF
ncbi:MAG: hypothetical protein GX432_11400 [Candidatus Atribacteria bacterium]|nr:hypothetical protein [Candidatus Atribacteria bacterium]